LSFLLGVCLVQEHLTQEYSSMIPQLTALARITVRELDPQVLRSSLSYFQLCSCSNGISLGCSQQPQQLTWLHRVNFLLGVPGQTWSACMHHFQVYAVVLPMAEEHWHLLTNDRDELTWHELPCMH
jgi:hypothetical protein